MVTEAPLTVHAPDATQVWLCLFDPDDRETRVPLAKDGPSHHGPALAAGTRYGLRADGPYDPPSGLWFDPAKLLLDPYATQIDRRFAYDPRLAAPRETGFDTAPLMPKAIVPHVLPPLPCQPPIFAYGGLIYELGVRGFTMRHSDVPPSQRGTIAALAHPAVIAHLKALHVSAVELMPITAWIDERHLPPLGLANAWGYNPVGFMALDPGLVPGGIAELRDTVAALRAAGIGTILDLVFNHTGESDAHGPTLSLRGLDARGYFRHAPDGSLVNHTGTGNTIACDAPPTRRLILDSLRHFVTAAGVDGFRFDLAPILGRTAQGFSPDAALLREIAGDPLLADRILIAEPWDIGPDGYQLGRFPPNFLEWSDRYRDDVRRFWRGDDHAIGALATRLAGSSDIFGGPATRTVNFIAAHDGFTLADMAAHRHKHNAANGEQNRDGHDENLSWNNGAEGATDEPAILAARRRDIAALLATLFASRGTIMLAAGDEFGRSQSGNNNAYAQDNAVTWIDWDGRDRALEDTAFALAATRAAAPALADPAFAVAHAVGWLHPDGRAMTEADWNAPAAGAVAMRVRGGVTVLINRTAGPARFVISGEAIDLAARSVWTHRHDHAVRNRVYDQGIVQLAPRPAPR